MGAHDNIIMGGRSYMASKTARTQRPARRAAGSRAVERLAALASLRAARLSLVMAALEHGFAFPAARRAEHPWANASQYRRCEIRPSGDDSRRRTPRTDFAERV